jgi:LuxR family maltose regulon positive regulatory protein
MNPAREEKSRFKKKISVAKGKKRQIPSKLAVIDHLTNFYNRRHFDKFLKRLIIKSKKEDKHFSLLMIDIDNFKAINDKYGHVAGDTVLIDLAKVIRKSVRSVDKCFRYGGDEIAVILPDAEKDIAEKIVTRIKTKVEKHKFSINSEDKIFLKLSIGLAVSPDDGLSPKVLINKADDLLYRVKRRKRRIIEPFILKTKLIPPILKESVILRPRLVSLLKNNFNKKLIHVVADAGYGKTTLLTQFINELKIPYIWYQIDKSDQEIDIFIHYLIEGTRRYFPEFGKRTLSVLNHTTGREINLEVLIGTFINELLEVSEQKLLFFFDDLQEIYGFQQVISGLKYLLNNIPPHVSIIIATRGNPPFSLDRLHFKNEILHIDQEDLKFSKGEIKSLCKQVGGFNPNSAELNELQGDSEGWITALQFLIHSFRQKSIFAKNRKSLLNRLDDYFENEVFSSLKENFRLFLTATSVFEYLSPEACNHLMSRDDSEQILKGLQEKHLFVSAYEDVQPSYRYHHLFRNFLSEKLKKTGFYQNYQNRAGVYWEKQGVFPTAVQHYFEAKNFKSIARLIKKFGTDYLNIGKFEFIKYCIENLPDTIVYSSPTLIRLKGNINVWNCDWDSAEVYYRKARRLAQRQQNYLEIFKTIHNQLVMKLQLGKYKGINTQIRKVLRSKKLRNLNLKVKFLNLLGEVLLFEGQEEETVAVLKEALNISKKIGDSTHMYTTLNNLSVVEARTGNFIDAQNYLETLIAKLSSHQSPFLTTALLNSGNALRMQGNLAEADEVLKEAQKYARFFSDRIKLYNSYTSRAWIKIFCGELEQAEHLLNEAEALGVQFGHTFDLSRIWQTRAELALNRQDFFQIKKHIEKNLGTPMSRQTKTSFLITKAKVELSMKNLKAAEKTLTLVSSSLGGSKYELMRYYLQLARFYLLKRDEIKSKNFINKSITLAEKNSYDFLLSYELKHCAELMNLIKKIGLKSHYIQHILLKLPYQETLEISREPEVTDYDYVIRLLGRVQIFKAGKEIKGSIWRTKGLQELFGFFVVNLSQPIGLEKIINIFWFDYKPANAKRLFHVALHWIRKAVGKDIIIFTKDGYRLSSQYKYWIDVQEFENLSKEGDRLLKDGNRVGAMIKYEEAFSLYRGDFMDDFYGDWCQQKRRYFEEIYLNMLKKLAHGQHNIGNSEKALKFCDLFINKDPYHEDIYCLAMRCYAALNDPSGLQNCFSNLENVLRKNLNTTPHSGTIKLFKKLIKERRT